MSMTQHAMKWYKGAPPMDGRRYLLCFKGSTDSDDIICTGSYRYARPYNEPAPNTKAWRCDCCGKFSDPYYWAEIPKRPDEQINTAIHGTPDRMSVRTGVTWQLQRTPYESEIDIVSDKRVIATIEAGEDKEEIASLIAAAPDMLEALEIAIWIIEKNIHGPVAGYSNILDAVRKARGEE